MDRIHIYTENYRQYFIEKGLKWSKENILRKSLKGNRILLVFIGALFMTAAGFCIIFMLSSEFIFYFLTAVTFIMFILLLPYIKLIIIRIKTIRKIIKYYM